MTVQVFGHCLADPVIGMGHAVRLGALLDHVPATVDLIGIVDASTAGLHFPARMQRRGSTTAQLIDAVTKAKRDNTFTVAIVDLREFDAELWKLTDDRTLTIAISDRGGDDIGADVVINPSDHRDMAVYRRLPPDHVVLSGLSYVPLRRAFEGGAGASTGRKGIGFVIGSGMKSENWTRDLVKHLATTVHAPIRMVVSSTFKDIAALKRDGAKQGIDIQTGLSADQMREFYQGVEICVMTGGTAIYEAMAVGVPILCYPILDDMVEESTLLGRMGALIALPPEAAAAARLGAVIMDTLGDSDGLYRIARTACRLVDGRGCSRIVQLLERIWQASLNGRTKAEALRLEALACSA